jgi:hypothetical protein
LALSEAFGDLYRELLDESDFREEPRRLDEILQAESEFFDRVWYQRSLSHEYRLEGAGEDAERQRHAAIAEPGRRRVEERFGGPENLRPYDDFEWGSSTASCRRCDGCSSSDWDFLDT